MEGGMAAHSSILAWRIPWTEEFVHGVAESWTWLSNLTPHSEILHKNSTYEEHNSGAATVHVRVEEPAHQVRQSSFLHLQSRLRVGNTVLFMCTKYVLIVHI